jgi:hypothetical protein
MMELSPKEGDENPDSLHHCPSPEQSLAIREEASAKNQIGIGGALYPGCRSIPQTFSRQISVGIILIGAVLFERL